MEKLEETIQMVARHKPCPKKNNWTGKTWMFSSQPSHRSPRPVTQADKDLHLSFASFVIWGKFLTLVNSRFLISKLSRIASSW